MRQRTVIARLGVLLAAVILPAATAAPSVADEPITKPSSTTRGPMTVSSIEAVFVPTKLATSYTVTATDTALAAGQKLAYRWDLELRRVDPENTSPAGFQHTDPTAPNYASAALDLTCNNAKLPGRKVEPSTPGLAINDSFWKRLGGQFIWYHGDKGSYPDSPGYGCDHTKMGPRGHQGVVYMSVTDGIWQCTAMIDGSNLSTAPVYSTAPSCRNEYREHIETVGLLVNSAIKVERAVIPEIGRANKKAIEALTAESKSLKIDAARATGIKDGPSSELGQAAKLDGDAVAENLDTKDGQTKALADLAAALKLKKQALAKIDAAIAAQPAD